MNKWLQDYIKESVDNANQQIGRYQGQLEAYDNVADRLDPAKFCQTCGYGYRSWGSEAEQAASRAKHESEHQPKPTI